MRIIFDVALMAAFCTAQKVIDQVHHLGQGLDLLSPHGHAQAADVWESHHAPEHFMTAQAGLVHEMPASTFHHALVQGHD